VLQPIGDPFGILDVRFATRDRFDMLGIGHDQFEEAFQTPRDRQPIDPRALHPHVGAPFLQQPGAQSQQIRRVSAEGADLFAPLSGLDDDQTDD
jgi:hypothetical protein